MTLCGAGTQPWISQRAERLLLTWTTNPDAFISKFNPPEWGIINVATGDVVQISAGIWDLNPQGCGSQAAPLPQECSSAVPEKNQIHLSPWICLPRASQVSTLQS